MMGMEPARLRSRLRRAIVASVGRAVRVAGPSRGVLDRPPASLLRAGVTLLEVLISMGLLLLGLLGVGAMLAGGRFEVLQGAKSDQATMVGRAAFHDLKVRGYLNPLHWYDAPNVYQPGLQTGIYFPAPQLPLVASQTFGGVAIDPLAIAAASEPSSAIQAFPAIARTTIAGPLLPRISPWNTNTASNPQAALTALADGVFRFSDDLLLANYLRSTSDDSPPAQQMFPPVGNSPPLGGYSKRASDGNYSWIATVVGDPFTQVLGMKCIVDVAVFYRRDMSTVTVGSNVFPVCEALANVTFPLGGGVGGGEAQLSGVGTPSNDPGQKFTAGVRPGQWLMIVGQTIPQTWYYRWYRVVAADMNIGGTQNVTLAGPDWPTAIMLPGKSYAWMFEGIVAVYEKNMRLEIP